jgi:hypothetical protein
VKVHSAKRRRRRKIYAVTAAKQDQACNVEVSPHPAFLARTLWLTQAALLVLVSCANHDVMPNNGGEFA